jgi:subtilisin family serine protease
MRPQLSLVVAFFLVAPASVRAAPFRAGETYVPGEVIVKLRDRDVAAIRMPAVSASLRQAVMARLKARYGLEDGGPLGRRGREGPCWLLRTGRDVPTVCAALQADPEVAYAQPNYIYRICREPNDPDFADQYAHQLICMQAAWDLSTGSRDIVVALIGTGVDVNHPDLKENIWINPGEIPGNGIDDDDNGYVDDVHGWNFGNANNNVVPSASPYDTTPNHETQVAGVIAARGNNGAGVVGVNWQASLMVLRVSLSFTSKEVADALDYAAANGARVVNMSFGGDSFGAEGDRLVQTAIDGAYARGVLLVASAGNSDSSRPNYPAAYYNVMAVASTNAEDKKTGHSTFGAWVDIAAPGTDIVTTDLGGSYIATAGTSFSSPYVAAVATLLFAYRPGLTAVQARAILENTVDPLDYGELDPNLCYIGAGRVNAYQALLAADRAYPLGEIVSPGARQTYAADGNAIEVYLFVHGDSYQVDYRGYGQAGWRPVAAGAAPSDPNGFAYVVLANPGVGAYELRLRVGQAGYTHTDRKLFAVERVVSKVHWPKPDDFSDSYEYFMGSPLCLDVNGDGRNEVCQVSLDLLSFLDGGKVNLWDQNGKPLPHWPVTMDTWPTSVAVGDIDGDGDYEVVVASEYDGEVCAYHVENGQRVKGAWPAAVGGWYGWIPSGPVLADLDGDGDSEILIALDMESADTDGLLALQGDGTFLWQRRYTSAGPISAGDLNQDGRAEIALSGYGPGLSRFYTFILDDKGQSIARWVGGSAMGTVIADLDADGKSEVVFCTEKEVVAGRVNGGTAWKTKVPDPLDAGGGLCVGDLDGDGLGEVYVAVAVEADEFLFTRVYAFDHQGHALTAAGYPKTIMGDPARCVPLIADIDGDTRKELLVGSAGEPIMAWEADGSVTPGFPLLDLAPDFECTPALADLDQDGTLEIMVAADDYRFHVLDLAVPNAAETMDWGMIRHDPQNSGWAARPPQIDLLSLPAQVKPGQQLTVALAAANPGDFPLHWRVGTLPDGAHYDANHLTVSWEPGLEQVFQSYTFGLVVTDGVRQDSRTVVLEVVPDAIYHADMDADPNWTLDDYWNWGVPIARAGAREYDPKSGRTGANVVGCALRGNYLNKIAETRYATTPAIDCRGFRNIRLCFWRWLTVDWPNDSVCLQVSADGTAWTDLWTPEQSPLMDEGWKFVEYTVPAGSADDRPTVYFRWGLGPTDASVAYGGWNIDDVQVVGDTIGN